jgi:hypothetical protein
MRESSFTDLIPLWRTLREEGVTCLVTPALDYVGALEIGTLDVRFANDDAIAGIGEGLRQLVSGLDDGTILHFLYRVELGGAEDDIREYEGLCGGEGKSPALAAYVDGRAAWLRRQPLRKARVYLFFSETSLTAASLTRGLLGAPLVFGNTSKFTQADHLARLQRLAQLRDRLLARLTSVGVPGRELDLDALWRLHFQLLNPNRGKAGAPPRASLRDNLFDPATIKAIGPHVAEYTEAEQLFNEDLEEGLGHFRQGNAFRRAATLKILPEGGTSYYGIEGFLEELRGDEGPIPYTLAVTVAVKHQAKARWALSTRHELVTQLRAMVPWLSSQSVAQEEADRAHQSSIRALFEELNEMSTKVVALSVSLLLEAPTLEILERRTEAARAAFARAGNAQMQEETWTQIPAFLSMLPGAGPYQLRQKGCTSRNAADFLPVFGSWRGTTRPASILQTPAGDVFRFDPFDRKLVNAHHGVVVADTGSGKSVSLGALTLDARAAGVEAVLIDNGGSWAPLTELLGGIHVPVDLKTSISPFVSYAEMLDRATGEVANEELELAVGFIEVAVQDRSRPPFDKVERDAVSKAIRWCYETKFRARPDDRPLIGDFADALKLFPWTHPDDRRIAEDLGRRLEIFTTGIYRDFLNKPSQLRFDVPLLTFDLAKISENPNTRAIAMATIIQAISNRAQRRQVPTLVEIDEAHEYLGADDATEQFLGRCYRKMRKFGTGMWMISQKLNDFLGSRIGREAILGNATIRIFLRHQKGNHGPVIEHFKLSPRAAAAFQGLGMKPGHYSDLLLMYGPHMATIRLALTPLAYWILTTDRNDKDLLARAVEKNPLLDRLSLLQELAARYPNGVVGAGNH